MAQCQTGAIKTPHPGRSIIHSDPLGLTKAFDLRGRELSLNVHLCPLAADIIRNLFGKDPGCKNADRDARQPRGIAQTTFSSSLVLGPPFQIVGSTGRLGRCEMHLRASGGWRISFAW